MICQFIHVSSPPSNTPEKMARQSGTLPEINSSHLPRGVSQKGKDRLPTINVSGAFAVP